MCCGHRLLRNEADVREEAERRALVAMLEDDPGVQRALWARLQRDFPEVARRREAPPPMVFGGTITPAPVPDRAREPAPA